MNLSKSLNTVQAPKAEVTEEWWQWASDLETEGGDNPFDDETGEFAWAGDVPGPEFFLAAGGTNTSTTTDPPLKLEADRHFDVPLNAKLVVPIINTAESVPDYEFWMGVPAGKEQVEAWIDAFRDEYVQSAFLEIDGVQIDVSDFFVKTDFFSMGTPERGELSYDLFGQRPEDVEQEPAMSGGYWAVVSNLDLGEHTLRFGGSVDYWNETTGNYGADGTIDFEVEIVAHIKVVTPAEYRAGGTDSAADLVLG